MKKTAIVWVAARAFGVAALSVHGIAMAQQAPADQAPPVARAGTRIISFQEAIRIALERNITVRAAQNSAALGAVGVDEARGQFLPNLTASTTGARNYGRNFDTSAGQVVNQTTTSMSLGLNTGVVVFDGLGNIAQLRSAKLSSAASEEELRRARETVAFDVASSFLALIQRQEQLRVLRENLQAVTLLESQIQTFVDNGARTIADLYQQQANVANARFAVVDAERTAELSKVDLMQTLQLDPTGTYEFEAPEDTTAAAASQDLDLGTLQSRASTQRIDLKAGEKRVAAADQDVKVARSNRWPTVSLNAGYSSAYNTASPFDFSEQLDQRRGGSVSLGVQVPIFDRFATSNATRRAEIQADNERLSQENLQQDVALQVRRAHLDFNAAKEQLIVAIAQVRAAEQALQASQERYTAGASTLVELTQARATQVQAASTLVFARYNLQFQRTLMDYYTGDLDPARLSGQ
jgi:outer membrane protein